MLPNLHLPCYEIATLLLCKPAIVEVLEGAFYALSIHLIGCGGIYGER